MNKLVRDWMTANVITVSTSSCLDEADSIMVEKGIRRLLVVDGTELVGILSQGDVRAAKATAAADRPAVAMASAVGAIMTPNPVTIPETATIAFAAQIMLQLKVSGLPVADERGTLRGILSESDLFRYIVAHTLAA